jgi:4-amino-4-deoxy-L-arabinose transferase-like glycosyltransferase
LRVDGTEAPSETSAGIGETADTTPIWAQPRFVAAAIAVYLLTHFAVRLAMWHTLGIDDAEQALFAQDFSWSYRRSAPPLFTWILIALGKLIGVNILSISLIRYALLAVIFGFAYATARRLITDPRLSALAVYSFAAIYLFAFYSHHDLTHTTVMTAMIAVSWYIFVRLAETPRLGWYLALGGAFGLGLLGKWNFVMFAATLPLACLLHPDYRRLLLTWKILPAALLCVAIMLPTVVAALHGPTDLDTAGKVLGGGDAPYLRRVGEGIVRLFASVIAYPQPLLVLMALVFAMPMLRGVRLDAAAASAFRPVLSPAFVGATIAVSLALHLLLVVAVGAREFHERLMQPPLFILPLFLFMLVERGRPSPRAVNAFAILVALLVPVALAARIVVYQIGADYCGSCRNMVPFERLADDLQSAGFSGMGTIVAEGFHIGGNMRVAFPDARIIDSDYPPATWPSARGNGGCLLVWQDRDDREGEFAPRLHAYVVDKLGGARDAVPRAGNVAAPMYHSTRQYRLAYLLYPPTGDCR